MATRYVSKDGWYFQYVCDNVKPFYTALVNQGASVQTTPWVEEDGTGMFWMMD